jgi:hypothetical protein
MKTESHRPTYCIIMHLIEFIREYPLISAEEVASSLLEAISLQVINTLSTLSAVTTRH